jgi:sulfonate transport system ATP-binding protein
MAPVLFREVSVPGVAALRGRNRSATAGQEDLVSDAQPGSDPPPARADTRPEAVQVRGLRRAYGDRVIIDGLDLAIRSGEFLALLGKSGCGKTTLLRTLSGLDRPDGGRVVVPVRRAVVFQEPRMLPWRKVWRNVALGVETPDARDKALAALGEVGLERHADVWPGTLSGGEAQRAALARALIREPQLLLLDEPFASLDALTRIRMHGLVERLCRVHQPATVLVTHDVDEAVLLADRVAVMGQGRILRDVPIDLPHPRQIGVGGFDELRQMLLGELGVQPGTQASLAMGDVSDEE